MNNPINISGITLEDSMESELRNLGLPYKRNKSGIDFIVGTGNYYIECKNQTQGGSVVEKLPHTIWKYKMKYDFDTLYIVQPYQESMGKVLDHIKFLESVMSIKVRMVSYTTMVNILRGSEVHSASNYW